MKIFLKALPASGGTYVYMAELGDIVGFLYSWLSILVSRPSSGSIVAISFSEYVAQ